MLRERTSLSCRWSQISSICFFVKTLFETVEDDKTLSDFILDLQQISVFTPNVTVACLTEVKKQKNKKTKNNKCLSHTKVPQDLHRNVTYS